MARRGSPGMARSGLSRPVKVGLGRARLGSQGQVRRSTVRPSASWQGRAGIGVARCGSWGVAWLGMVWPVKALRGMPAEAGRGTSWQGLVRPGRVRLGSAVEAGRGWAWPGTVGLGKAWQALLTPVPPSVIAPAWMSGVGSVSGSPARACSAGCAGWLPGRSSTTFLARSHGGDDDITNLCPVCAPCHRRIEERDMDARCKVRWALMPSNYEYLQGKLEERVDGWLERHYPRAVTA